LSCLPVVVMGSASTFISESFETFNKTKEHSDILSESEQSRNVSVKSEIPLSHGSFLKALFRGSLVPPATPVVSLTPSRT
jgi:hypothetical protein